MGREISHSDIWVTVRIHEQIENAPDSIADTLDRYTLKRINWSEFKAIPGARDILDQTVWEELEREAERLVPESSWRILFRCFFA